MALDIGIKAPNFKAFTDAGDEVEISNLREAVSSGKELLVVNRARKINIKAKLVLSERQIEILLDGGVLNHAAKKRAGR